jgi:hypothetical protein
VALLLDAGGLVGYDRRNATVIAFIEFAQRRQVAVRTTSGIVAQVWRGGSRQARLARLLRGVDERELSRSMSRSVGVLLGNAGTSDVIDASLVDIALDGDEILTSDPDDIARLANAAGKRLVIIPIGA